MFMGQSGSLKSIEKGMVKKVEGPSDKTSFGLWKREGKDGGLSLCNCIFLKSPTNLLVLVGSPPRPTIQSHQLG